MMKPGYKTTEFWLSLAAVLVGAVLSSGVLQSAPDAVTQVVGLAATILGALGYVVPRSFAKASDARAQVLVEALKAAPVVAQENPPKP